MEYLLSPAWTAVLNLAAVTLSLAAVGTMAIGYLRRRRRSHGPDPATRAYFGAEMEIQMITQRYARSLDKIANLIDAERMMLASPAHLCGPNDTPVDPPAQPPPQKTVAETVAAPAGRRPAVHRMTKAVAEARQLLEDGLDPSAVSKRVPVSREGLDLMAKVNAARPDSKPGGQMVPGADRQDLPTAAAPAVTAVRA